MTFSEDGVLLDTEFQNTVINNHLRLTYVQVQDYFDGKQEEPPIPMPANDCLVSCDRWPTPCASGVAKMACLNSTCRKPDWFSVIMVK